MGVFLWARYPSKFLQDLSREHAQDPRLPATVTAAGAACALHLARTSPSATCRGAQRLGGVGRGGGHHDRVLQRREAERAEILQPAPLSIPQTCSRYWTAACKPRTVKPAPARKPGSKGRTPWLPKVSRWFREPMNSIAGQFVIRSVPAQASHQLGAGLAWCWYSRSAEVAGRHLSTSRLQPPSSNNSSQTATRHHACHKHVTKNPPKQGQRLLLASSNSTTLGPLAGNGTYHGIARGQEAVAHAGRRAPRGEGCTIRVAGTVG